MRKNILVAIVCLVLLMGLTGCGNKDSKEKTTVKRTEQEQAIFDYITEHTLTLSTLSANKFFVFSKDGKYARYYSSKVVMEKYPILLLETGTYDIKDDTLTFHMKRQFLDNYNATNKKYEFTKIDATKDEEQKGIKIKTEKLRGVDTTFLDGEGLFRLHEVKDNVPDKLVKYIKELLNDDIEKFDENKAKALEYKEDK